MNWFDELKNQALVLFPNMPTLYIENAIHNAVRKFFRETHLLKDETYIDAECMTGDFIIDLPPGRTIVQVQAVYSNAEADSTPLLDETWCKIPPTQNRFGSGFWVELQFAEPTLAVAPCYRITKGKYCVVYSWTTTSKDCDLPHHFIGKYVDALLHGVLGELFLIPMENDSQSASMAKYHLQEFDRAKMNAGVEETQNHTKQPLFMHGASFI